MWGATRRKSRRKSPELGRRNTEREWFLFQSVLNSNNHSPAHLYKPRLSLNKIGVNNKKYWKIIYRGCNWKLHILMQAKKTMCING